MTSTSTRNRRSSPGRAARSVRSTSALAPPAASTATSGAPPAPPVVRPGEVLSQHGPLSSDGVRDLLTKREDRRSGRPAPARREAGTRPQEACRLVVGRDARTEGPPRHRPGACLQTILIAEPAHGGRRCSRDRRVTAARRRTRPRRLTGPRSRNRCHGAQRVLSRSEDERRRERLWAATRTAGVEGMTNAAEKHHAAVVAVAEYDAAAVRRAAVKAAEQPPGGPADVSRGLASLPPSSAPRGPGTLGVYRPQHSSDQGHAADRLEVLGAAVP